MPAHFETDSRISLYHRELTLFSVCRRAAVLALVVLSACSYQSGDIANPLTRKFEWFSFLGGDDMRAACAPGAPERFRLIYNGSWKEQVRIYELGFTGPAQLDQRVIGPGQLFDLSASDLLAPWRGDTATVTLTHPDYGKLLRALDASGAYTSPVTTLTLASTDFYWVAASCHAGVFHLTAWLYPSDAFAHAQFPAFIAPFDRTGVPFNPPRPWTDAANYPLGSADRPARGPYAAQGWTIGIAQDRLVDQLIF